MAKGICESLSKRSIPKQKSLRPWSGKGYDALLLLTCLHFRSVFSCCPQRHTYWMEWGLITSKPYVPAMYKKHTLAHTYSNKDYGIWLSGPACICACFTYLMPLVCPCSTRTHSPVSMSHTLLKLKKVFVQQSYVVMKFSI